eukprot:TRINITY_DN3779_c0_g2_i14.p1 TRINITY_DN3779_c0_g2~~TRINITY_DN3779_c0_g2_i14.p1  ORF type:complete len:210 (-),score=95.55 TRINITY_DN3779_c0_g2_i14:44-673(-)
MEFAKSIMKGGKAGAKGAAQPRDPKQSKTTGSEAKKPEANEGANKMEEELKTMVTQLIDKNATNQIKNTKLTKDMDNMMELMKQTIKELDSMTLKDLREDAKESAEDKKETEKPLPMPATPISVHANTVKEPKKSFESVDEIISYLEMSYGKSKFMETFTRVKDLDTKLNGKIVMEEYQKELKDTMSPEEVKKDLLLYLALCRTQQETF